MAKKLKIRYMYPSGDTYDEFEEDIEKVNVLRFSTRKSYGRPIIEKDIILPRSSNNRSGGRHLLYGLENYLTLRQFDSSNSSKWTIWPNSDLIKIIDENQTETIVPGKAYTIELIGPYKDQSLFMELKIYSN